MDYFKVNIFHTDSYITKPGFNYENIYSKYPKAKLKRVTVIRLFGATESGLKVCLHIHKYLPHMSIRQTDLFALYGGSIPNDGTSAEQNVLALFLSDIGAELRKKFNDNQIDFINDFKCQAGEGRTTVDDLEEFIVKIHSYQSRSMYGYHDKPECFYRIYFYCHSTMNMAKNILESGLINNTTILLHNCLELHLQFYIDNQIYLNNLYLKSVTFRKTVPFKGDPENDNMFQLIINEKLKSINFQMDFNQIPATSTSFLECDALVEDIVPISYENLFPGNKTFVPSLPGIVNLLNDQFLRNKNNLAYENLLKPVTNIIERSYPEQHLNENLHYKILESFLNRQSNENCLLQSPTKNDVLVGNSNENDDEDEDNDEIEMSFTQQQLNLINPIYDDESPDYFLDDQGIPQLDGMDDNDGYVQADSKHSSVNQLVKNKKRKFRLIYKNTKIPLESSDFGRLVIPLSKMPLLSILNTSNVVVSKELNSKIFNQMKQLENFPCKIESNRQQSPKQTTSNNVCNSPSNSDNAVVYSYYSNYSNHDFEAVSKVSQVDSRPMSNLGDTSLLSPFQQCGSLNGHNFHSTPNTDSLPIYPKRSRKQLSILSRINLKDSFQSVSDSKLLGDLKTKDMNFVLSQDSQIPNTIKFDEMSSINSKTSFRESCDRLAVDATNTLKWDRNLEMTLMSLELHVQTRDHLLPNPSYDAIQAAVFAIYSENLKPIADENESDYSQNQQLKLVYLCAIVVRHNSRINSDQLLLADNKILHVVYVSSEIELLFKLTSYVKNFDPDIVLGYMVDTLSWGYLLQRSLILDIDIISSMSRITNPYQARENFAGDKNKSPKLIGRIVLNAWVILNYELTLRSYSFENVFYHLFEQSVSKYSHKHLSSLWTNYQRKLDEQSQRLVMEYYLTRVTGLVKIVAKLNLIGRTYNLSCLFGMKFEDVFNRGSQFRVESMLFPLCRLENFLPIRFAHNYTYKQCAPECIPLVLEPGGIFCKEPVAVLDFQSLYPSIMIAYNYCYSTCLGKVKNIMRSNDTIGCYRLSQQQDLLRQLGKDIHISPNGVIFVKPNVRRGLLPKMLENLLISRILVKTEMKQVTAQLADDKISLSLKRKLKSLKRKLDILQLGLKLIANVTYGYTSANFSGRMPCVDIADSIVSKGRESLEKAISFINEWGVSSGNGAKVIYGDTDSVFISFPNASLKEAFGWADYMAKEITKQYPYPMAIKVEKIYQPCILLAKKRYCGYSYESVNQSAPIFDAKGIETVRRDSCNATSKILDKCIRILFDFGGDILQIKPYLQWQIKKILSGRVSILNDFVFAKEYKGLDNYINQSAIPSCIIAHRRLQRDPMNEPKLYERVPYVIVAGSPHDKLADLARDPLDLLADRTLKLNASYYIQRVIFPPLTRLFAAIPNSRLDQLMNWYDEVRHYRANELKNSIAQTSLQTNNIKHFFRAAFCVICRTRINTDYSDQSQYPLCLNCAKSGQRTTTIVKDRFWSIAQKLDRLQRICSKCCGCNIRQMTGLVSDCSSQSHLCISRECHYLFRYHQSSYDFDQMHKLDQAIGRKLLINSNSNNGSSYK